MPIADRRWKPMRQDTDPPATLHGVGEVHRPSFASSPVHRPSACAFHSSASSSRALNPGRPLMTQS